MRIATLCLILASTSPLISQTWKWEKAPAAGENILIHINDVPEAEGLYLVYYGFDGTRLVSGDVGQLPNNVSHQIHTAVPIHDHMSWIRLALKDESGEIISADESYVSNPKALPGASQIEKALSLTSQARATGKERQDAEATVLLREAIQLRAEWMEEPAVINAYYGASKGSKSTADLDLIKSWIKEMPGKVSKTNEALMVNVCRVTKDFGDTMLLQDIRKKMDKTFPLNILLQEEVVTQFRSAEPIAEKIKLRDELKSRFGVTTDNKGMFDQMTGTLVQLYAGKDDWAKVKQYISEIEDPMTRARICNQYAWTLSGESIDAAAPNLGVAYELASTMMKILDTPGEGPAYLTKSEWQRNMDYTRGQYGDTYALVVFKQGKIGEALDHQAFSVKQSRYEDFDMNERYALFLEKAGRTAELEAHMDKIMVMGKASAKVLQLHKQYWTKSKSQDELYATYLRQIEGRAKALMVEKLSKKWEDRDAVSFTLKDLKGNEVSLADYKGKTVVLDFWATWCGPCKASFPGMQKAVDHYASSDDVVFLFIDTWERGDDVDAKVGKFISDNSYSFHVLMDRENKVVTDYGIDGIPTKFIIGPDQKIRFKSVGYGGNNEELVKELMLMIEMAQGLVKA